MWPHDWSLDKSFKYILREDILQASDNDLSVREADSFSIRVDTETKNQNKTKKKDFNVKSS